MSWNLGSIHTMVMVAAVFLGPVSVGADVFMKEKQHTDGMTIMGQAQPARDSVATVWLAKDNMRRDQGETSIIAKIENGKVIITHLNHQKKTYTELPLGQDGGAGMTGDVKVKVTPTGETKQIGKWKCRKYLQEMDVGMMPTSSEIWATEDIQMPYHEFYERLSSAVMSQQPGMKPPSEAFQEETKKIKGIPVLTITSTTMMKDVTIKSSRELVEIREDKAPAGTFEIPPGYARQEMPRDAGPKRMPGKPKPQ
jgi:hypothetical protein